MKALLRIALSAVLRAEDFLDRMDEALTVTTDVAHRHNKEPCQIFTSKYSKP